MRAWFSLAAAVALVAPAPAFAQEAALGLVDTVLLARDNSLAAQASRQAVQAAEAQRAVTVGNALPNLSVSTSANYQELPPGLANLFGGAGTGGGLVGFPAQGTSVDTTLQGSVVLFDAFATQDAIRIADYQVHIGRLGVIQAQQEAMAQAAVSYFNVLRQEGLAAVAANAVKQAQEHMRLGQLRLEAGTGTRADVLQQRAQLASAQGRLMQARNAVTIARMQLANALNAPVADRPLAADPRVPSLAVTPEAMREGVSRRSEVRQLEVRTAIDEAQVQLESRALWPNLQGSTRYAMRGLDAGQFTAGVNLNWAIFDGFRARNRMEVALNQAQTDRIQLEQTRQNVALEIREQFQLREEAQARIAIAREGLSAAQEAYRLAVLRFEVGVATTFEVTDVQTTLTGAANDYVSAVNDWRVAQIRLARAMGLDIAAYLTDVRS